MRRTIQCNGIRTVGTIVRRFIQFVWQKIFTKDCDNDSKATRKFSVYIHLSSPFSLFLWVSAHHNRTNETNEQGRKKNQMKSENKPLPVQCGSFLFSFPGHAHTTKSYNKLIYFLFRLQKITYQNNQTRSICGLNLEFYSKL